MSETHAPAELIKLSSAAAPSMHLNEIQIIRSSCERMPNAPTEESELQISHGFKVSFGHDEAERTVGSMIDFYCRGHFTENEQRNDVFSVKARFLATYSIRENDDVSPESVSAFARLNGVYNAWPYWREFVQNSATRMGLPAIVLPLIMGNQIAEMLADQDAKGRASGDESDNSPTPQAAGD
jgi:hypothetical protein